MGKLLASGTLPEMTKTGMRFVRTLFGKKCWYLIFSVTSKCNQRCAMCFNWKHETESNSLSLEEIRKIAPHFPSLFQLTLSGGEPILRADLPEIVQSFCQARPIPRITLPSNGQLPERLEAVAARICKENPQSTINVALSLDGVGALHDTIRGVAGAFEAHQESKERITRLMQSTPNLRLVVASVYSELNRGKISELFEYIKETGTPQIHGLMFARGVTRDVGARTQDGEDFLKRLAELQTIQMPHLGRFGKAWATTYTDRRMKTHRQGRMVDPCRAGSKLLVLDHKGELAPCEVFGPLAEEGAFKYNGAMSFGNLRDVKYDPSALLNSEDSRRLCSFISRGGCNCTFECALLNNFALNYSNYFRILARIFTSS